MFRRDKDPMVDVKKGLMVQDARRKAIDEASNKPLPKSYKVNELANTLHPGHIKAELVKREVIALNTYLLTFKSLSDNGKFPYFEAGQFISISARINESIVTRPYSIFSSPNEALEGILSVAVGRDGFFSSHLIDNMELGTKVIIGDPLGDFHYNSLRDKDTILAIAGGTGVTPFISMIKAIEEGSEDFNLTLIYGVRTRKHLLYDFRKINNPKIKVIVVFSDERVPGYECGFITKELISKYMPKESSIFMCGPNNMYNFVSNELIKLGIEKHQIRMEHNSIRALEMDDPQEYELKVHIRDEVFTIKAKENETILTAFERSGLCVPSKCRSGICGLCHTRLINGDCFVDSKNDHVRLADKKFGYIHPCASYPISDMELDVPPLDILKEL
jgi:ferredoxin-NADP reductase